MHCKARAETSSSAINRIADGDRGARGTAGIPVVLKLQHSLNLLISIHATTEKKPPTASPRMLSQKTPNLTGRQQQNLRERT